MRAFVASLCLLLIPAHVAEPAPLVPASAPAADLRDITLEIQAAVNRGENVELPSGDFAISDTILVKRRYGWALKGAGRGDPNAIIGGWNGRSSATCLIWTGPVGKPMFSLPGSVCTAISDIGFCGGLTARAKWCNTGLLFPRDQGWSTGTESVFRNVMFRRFGAGIQCGEGLLDHNCADLKFHSAMFVECDIGLLVKHNQGLNYFFYDVSAGAVKTLFNFERGGCLHVYGAMGAFIDTVLKVDNADVNTGMYTLNGVKLETWAHPTCFVDAQANWLGRVSVSGAHVGSSGAPLFRVGKGLALVVRDSILGAKVLVEASSTDKNKPASAAFEHCTLYNAMPKKGVNAEVSWVGCWDGTGKRIKDGVAK